MPSVRNLVLLCLAVAVHGLFRGADSQTVHDTFIHVGPADSLEATYIVPAGKRPSPGWPALLFIHGFGLSKDWESADCFAYANRGYLTVAYSVRGHGHSSGLSSIMSLREREDLRRVISFVGSLPGADSGRIGIIGGSQGGLHGLWAVTDRLPVRAVSVDVIVPRWASDMLANGAIRRTLVVLLHTAGVRYEKIRDTLWGYLRRDAYDSLRILFPKGRDLKPDAPRDSRVPLYQFLKWQDHYFNPGEATGFYQAYGGEKKLYIGTVGHYSDRAPQEATFQSDQITRWFGHFLKGDSTGIRREPPVTYAFSGLPVDSAGNFTWRHAGAASWPLPGVRYERYYLSADSLLNLVPPARRRDSLIVRNEYRHDWYSFDTAEVEGFRGPRFEAAIPRHAIALTSTPLSRDLLWAGEPRIKFWVRADAAEFPLHVQVFEEDSLGRAYFVNRINFTARRWSPGRTGVITASGIAHAHRFSRGSRIRIVLTNLDVTATSGINSYPFVLPVFVASRVAVLMDARHPSWLELPVTEPPGERGSRGSD